MIVSGAAVHNEWCEAETMARLAEAAGVPAEDVIVEPKAQNTIQNVFYAHRIMEEHGWKTAEVGELAKPSAAGVADPRALQVRVADAAGTLAPGVRRPADCAVLHV